MCSRLANFDRSVLWRQHFLQIVTSRMLYITLFLYPSLGFVLIFVEPANVSLMGTSNGTV